METKSISTLRRKANSLFKKAPEGSVLEFVIDGQVYGTYDIPYNHFVEPDSKTPSEWVNGCACFGIELRGLKSPHVEIRISG
jgi:hypothetical protein